MHKKQAQKDIFSLFFIFFYKIAVYQMLSNRLIKLNLQGDFKPENIKNIKKSKKIKKYFFKKNFK